MVYLLFLRLASTLVQRNSPKHVPNGGFFRCINLKRHNCTSGFLFIEPDANKEPEYTMEQGNILKLRYNLVFLNFTVFILFEYD